MRPHPICLNFTHGLDFITVVSAAILFTLAYHHCIHRWEKSAANHPLTIKTCIELSYWKTCLCPSAVKANYGRLFSDREHVNTLQRGSSHSPCAAFLFMSFNSINGLLSHWTVLAPDFFFSLSLALLFLLCLSHSPFLTLSPWVKYLQLLFEKCHN